MHDTVGRNPAPPGMYKTLYTMGYFPYQLVCRISEPSTVVLNHVDYFGKNGIDSRCQQPQPPKYRKTQQRQI